MMKRLLLLSPFVLICTELIAQSFDTLRIPYGQPDILSIVPDARTGAMGYGGVALSADANATYINPSKLASAEKDFGASASYFRWLPALLDGYWVGYASAYKKLGEKQAIAASVQYFNYERWQLNGATKQAEDLAISASYSRQLGKNFSMGATLKYISSDMGYASVNAGTIKKGQSVAADISAFYRKQVAGGEGGEDFNWSLGAIASNLGNKIDFGSSGKYFLPAKLRIGGGLSYTATGKHRINVIADLSKLMVPTPSARQSGQDGSVLRSALRSFSDAPGGFKEEIQEIMFSVGAEYWYNNVVALRGGYYGESRQKRDQQFVTVGAGARIFRNFNADLAYNFSLKQGRSVMETLRTTVSFYIPGKKG
ncbi:type IX secretion system outer membrane channel protein PorV [Dyadobacter crusticola]|uniref:type IX secretion system outer membrane channel protein PorV n=1 Tax=Dyadobacter crusticola TaxID=292407 RepID=UPI000A059279|nr:type IX secretion system outer membrane channel protein PorV [Dyadobacter crusticola]